jgi:HK97 family phage major capsid protein
VDKKELMQELENLKKDLKEANSAEVAALKTKITDLETKLKSFEPNEKGEGGITAELKAIKDSIKVVSDQADGIQAEQKKHTISTENGSWKDILVKACEENKPAIEKYSRGESKSLKLEIKAVADVSTTNVAGNGVYGVQYLSGIKIDPFQIGHVRSFLHVMPGDPNATQVFFMKQNGEGEGAIAATAEKKAAAATDAASGLKPRFDLDWTEASVDYQNIAGIMPISKKATKSVPQIMQFIQTKVPELWYDVEDAEVLYGTGTAPHIKGILTSGNFTAGSGASATPLAEKIIADLSTFEDTYKRRADFIAVRPGDYWSFFTKVSSGSGEYNLPSNFVFVGDQLYISGIPVTRTTALTANDYIVGTRLGCDIMPQGGLMLEFFEQNRDNVETNQLTLRVEGSIALPVYGSTYFLKGSSAVS